MHQRRRARLGAGPFIAGGAKRFPPGFPVLLLTYIPTRTICNLSGPSEGRFMRRLEAGPSGWLAPTTAPGPGATEGNLRGDAVAAPRVQHAHPTARRPKPWFPGSPAGRTTGDRRRRGLGSWRRLPCIPHSGGATTYVHRGGHGASLQHRARNAEVSAESRSTTKLRFRIARSWSPRVLWDPAFRAPFKGRTARWEEGVPGANQRIRSMTHVRPPSPRLRLAAFVVVRLASRSSGGAKAGAMAV